MSGSTAVGFRPKFWVPGDWNALFGFGTNILVNLLVLTSLLRFVLKMPDEMVFGRILPALGLMLCLSTCYYAFLAWRLAARTGRSDVAALPSGFSVPHMFVVVFVVMPAAQARHHRPGASLGGRPHLGLRPKLPAHDGRLHRPGHPPHHPPRRPARLPRRHRHHLHLDEPG